MERKERDRQRKQTYNKRKRSAKIQKTAKKIKGLNKIGNKTLQVKQRNKNI